MIKKQLVVALVLLLLIPLVLVLGGALFSLINPEIAAGHPNYVRNFHLLNLLKKTTMWATAAGVAVLWLLVCLQVIRAKKRSPSWLFLAALGPIGLAVLAMLNDRATEEADRYARFVRNLNAAGSILPVGGIQTAWMRSYDEIANYPPGTDLNHFLTCVLLLLLFRVHNRQLRAFEFGASVASSLPLPTTSACPRCHADSALGGRTIPKIIGALLHEHVTVSYLAFPHLCSFALSPARSILQSDVPAMPTADHLARLHDSLTQGKSEVRTEVLYGVDAAVPSEQRNVQTLDFRGVA